ncbi:MAG TPA: serine hydrolase domain-containing protein [Puia sp.]|nr:serine hydrolase domain-containing protein [Puia sp.]
MRLFFLPLLLLSVTAWPQSRLTTRLDSLFHSWSSSDETPGFVLSIEKKGNILYRNAVGCSSTIEHSPHLDTMTNFRMASVTKQFTAMGIFLLEKEGRLGFDDPIGRWLPELPAHVGQKVLIRHLLTHTSGILDYESLIPTTLARQLLDDDVLTLLSHHDSTYFTPGSRFSYSNSGFCLLALIIERVSHLSFSAFLRDRIFVPLHMDHSFVYQVEWSHVYEGYEIRHRALGFARDSSGKIYLSDQSITSATRGDGGVYTSISDYSKWMKALQDNRLIQLAPTLRRLRSPITGMPDIRFSDYYAGGWFMTGTSPLILFHSGSTCGFSNFVIQLPGDEWSVFYFSNLADNKGPFRDIVRILQEEGVGDFSSVFRLHDLTN